MLLVGGGHAQIEVLRGLGGSPLPGVAITLVSPWPQTTYTGMIPGVLASLYEVREASIDVAALAARCGAVFVADRVRRIDADRHVVELERHAPLPWDVLALDVGSRPLGSASVAALPNVVPIKPIEEATERIEAFLAGAGARPPASAVVVGAGAGGVEVAFALRRRMAAPGDRVILVERGATLLPGAARGLRTRVADLCRRAGIETHLDAGAVTGTPDGVALGAGATLAAGLVVWATGAEGWPFLAGAGLRCDQRGFVLVDDFLRCADRPDIFAAGDCSRLVSAPWVARAGVYAVRQGPVLAHNLRVALGAPGRLSAFRPQRRFLRLLSTANRRAIVSYGSFSAHGWLWWWLKDRIDRRFVARFAAPDALRLAGSRRRL